MHISAHFPLLPQKYIFYRCEKVCLSHFANLCHFSLLHPSKNVSFSRTASVPRPGYCTLTTGSNKQVWPSRKTLLFYKSLRSNRTQLPSYSNISSTPNPLCNTTPITKGSLQKKTEKFRTRSLYPTRPHTPCNLAVQNYARYDIMQRLKLYKVQKCAVLSRI